MKNSGRKQYFLIVILFAVIIGIIAISRIVLINVLEMTEEQAATIAGIGEAVVAAVASAMIIFQLEQERKLEESQNNIEAARFLLQYNQAFIQDSNMCFVEQCLEQSMLRENPDEPLIAKETRQLFINYLVYLEGLAPLVFGNVLMLEQIDDLMAYRFFLAVNNPELQQDQLFAFPDYYRGCFKLYEKWRNYRIEHARPILCSETALDKWIHYEKYIDSPIVVRGIQNKKEMEEAAEILFDTDPYIYPAAFGSKNLARDVMPILMENDEGIFSASNIRIAVINDKVAGVVCIMENRAQHIDICKYRKRFNNLPKSFEDVCLRYFNDLNKYIIEPDMVYIPCISVKKQYRGKRIGQILLKSIIDEYKDKKMLLHVLAENDVAISLYEKYGFERNEELEAGYSADISVEPKCYAMVRTIRE